MSSRRDTHTEVSTAGKLHKEGLAAVAVRDVSMQFSTDRGSMTALSHVDLEIGDHEFVSLIGPSGCGKSTLLRVIGDLLEPTAGEALVNGKAAREARLSGDYGMVFQHATLLDWRTVQKNVEFPLELSGVDRKTREAKAAEMLSLVQLGDFRDHRPWQLSGGMQQRVAIARALSSDPALLLMDEPFGALDEITRDRLNLELLRIWADTGKTVIFVTHSIAEAVFLSTKVVVMGTRPGRIVEEIDIDLPPTRDDETREMPEYFQLVSRTREALRRS